MCGNLCGRPYANLSLPASLYRAAGRDVQIVNEVEPPLSHAAIVARELGIPAVVGCANATTRLHTGDRVRVDGGKGVVEIVEALQPQRQF